MFLVTSVLLLGSILSFPVSRDREQDGELGDEYEIERAAPTNAKFHNRQRRTR